MRVAVPVLETEVNGRKLVNAHFGKSNLFAIVDTETGKVELAENPALHLQRGRGIYIAQMFKEKGVEAVLVKEMGPGAFDKIRNALGIKVYLIPTRVKFLDEAVELFKEGKLTELLEPNEDEHEHQ
ncbi:NifB/NifX family molybdenum-iron cluster-binding protein [Thermovibrio sp.]